MIIVGERLNSSRKAIKEALSKADKDFLVREAKLQERAGAHYLDLNAASLLDKEAQALRWAVPLLQDEVNIPLSIDTPDPEAMGEALKVHRGRGLLNSISGEREKINRLLPLVREYNPRAIVLCLDDDGIPTEPEKALIIAGRLVDLLLEQGLGEKDIFVDPLVRPLAGGENAGQLFLSSLELIKLKLPGILTIAGLSNVSFGLPQRRLLNRAFLALAMQAGLDAVICDPLDRVLMASLAASTALLGRDSSLKNYLSLARGKRRRSQF